MATEQGWEAEFDQSPKLGKAVDDLAIILQSRTTEDKAVAATDEHKANIKAFIASEMRVKAKLERDHFITRNECFSQFPAITCLGARIRDLQEEGWTFKTEYTGRDYVYRLVSRPVPTTRPVVL